MTKPRLLLCLGALLVFGLQASSALADPVQGPAICANPSAEAPIAGNFRQLTIVGENYVPAGSTLRVRGNLKLARGACLDAFTLGTVKVRGDVIVHRGAILALGCTPGSLGPPLTQAPCDGMTTDDTVGGSIIARHALTMYLDGDTIWGNVISIGGGPGPTMSPYVNFPIKDNTIYGNVRVIGWQGTWFGFIRNTVSDNVLLAFNVGVSIGDTGLPDSTEVVTNTIGGNLICFGNSPAAQFGDSGGTPNTVGGRKIGQCADL
ncbi:MAG: hypothetical protein ACLPTJ_10145 [Solirubrobacteraceae bacterium]